MTSEKKAAISLDEIADKDLNDVSAADFLAALDAGQKTLHGLTYWPEKKKVEYWPEPESFRNVKVKDIIRIIRGEKKKVELEKHPGWERWRDPFDIAGNPVYDSLLNRLAEDIVARLRG